MTYRVKESPWGHQLEKVLDDGGAYLVATFEGSEAAVAVLSMMSLTLESKNGAKVDFGRFSA